MIHSCERAIRSAYWTSSVPPEQQLERCAIDHIIDVQSFESLGACDFMHEMSANSTSDQI
jgi:hypothetical protein